MRVQHALAAETRTVAYDSAGFGFSDPGPRPRTAGATVRDLRAALRGAGLSPPYVLVGWSWGGLVMRLFAFWHPEEVVGLVMVDASSERQMRMLIGDPKATVWRRALLRRLGRAEQLARRGDLRPGAPEYDEFVGEPRMPLTPAVDAAFRAQQVSPGRYRGVISEAASSSATLQEMDAARRTLGDIPLIALTAGRFFPMPPETVHPVEAWREVWPNGHDDIAALSTRGERRTIDSGHSIQIQEPDAVIAATLEVLAAARGV